MSRHYYRVVTVISKKPHLLFVNVVLLAIGFYFPIQKLTGFSISQILAFIFSVTFAVVVKKFCVWIVIYCALVKTALVCADTFPAIATKLQAPDNLSECILAINEELKRQISALRTNPELARRNFAQAPNFEINVPLIVQKLGEHLKGSFNGIKVKNSDIFVSVYRMAHFENDDASGDSLEYVTHFDHKRDTVHSRKIPLADPGYADYECVKAIKAGLTTKVRWDCSTYKRSKNQRAKTIKHYVGFRLELEGATLGFVNIEFHKHAYFATEDDMKDFVERELHVFRCFLEYHFLKKKIHALVQQKLIPV